MRFFSTSDRLQIAGIPWAIPEKNPSRREALVYYRGVAEHFDLDVRQYQGVEEVSGEEGSFQLRTRKMSGEEEIWTARIIVVATGGFHAPNMLNVSGEDLPKVLHYYTEPYPFYDQDVLVVGGSNSAVESSLELYRSGARVTLVHFLDWIDKGVKSWVVPDITNRVENGEISAFWRHRVAEITPESVKLRDQDSGRITEIPNDWVLAMTGWRSNPIHLQQLGVEIDQETGVPSHHSETMETNIPGVFIAGVLAAGNNANKIFIENGRAHGGQIIEGLRESGRL
jgi:thioredoxin reductase (NADPH)